jgi:hypothetical protein
MRSSHEFKDSQRKLKAAQKRAKRFERRRQAKAQACGSERAQASEPQD